MDILNQGEKIIGYKGENLYYPFSENKISYRDIKQYVNKDYMFHYHFNGKRTLISIKSGKSKFLSGNQQENVHDLFPSLANNLLELNTAVGYDDFLVIDGTMMNVNNKNIFIAHDILVCENDYLIGQSALWRYVLLSKLMGEPENFENLTKHKIAIEVLPNLWLAQIFMFDMLRTYQRSQESTQTNKGLILKKSNSQLEVGKQKINNEDCYLELSKAGGLKEESAEV